MRPERLRGLRHGAPALAALAAACLLAGPDARTAMARVAGGWFIAGSDAPEQDFARRLGLGDEGVLRYEAPRQWASTGTYGIDVTPVTREAWARWVVAAGGEIEVPASGPSLPITGVPYDLAVAYCEWRGEQEGRRLGLPTERMWERAARGDRGWIFPWGNSWDPARTRSGARLNDGLAPVWYHPSGVSPHGVLDTCGNVAEWVWSAPAGKMAWIRGCSYEDPAGHCRASARRLIPRDAAEPTIGFRCATSEIAPPPPGGPPDLRMSRGAWARLACGLLRWSTLGLRRCADSTVAP